MKSLNKTETPIFLSVVCSLFPKAIFLTLFETFIMPRGGEGVGCLKVGADVYSLHFAEGQVKCPSPF